MIKLWDAEIKGGWVEYNILLETRSILPTFLCQGTQGSKRKDCQELLRWFFHCKLEWNNCMVRVDVTYASLIISPRY